MKSNIFQDLIKLKSNAVDKKIVIFKTVKLVDSLFNLFPSKVVLRGISTKSLCALKSN